MIDINEIIEQMEVMEPRQLLFRVIKAEMIKRGHWRNKPRGTFKTKD